ncbi:XdhC family protein [Shivajiella indica]|uniref:XdhC family protein n=1 Tax=Shivajiella indica TaxID=872115 RepID=A0ABW5B6T2_9BACT
MKELHQIIKAYEKSLTRKQKTALATVVKVDGSAYRRPGARMLVTEDGELTGAISGGCLEGDALRKAQSVIFQQKSMIVTYDTTDEDDQKFGIGLGCNGIIQVLIEPINAEETFNPIELLKLALADRSASILVTFFSLKNSRSEQLGTKLLFKDNKFYGALDYNESGLQKLVEQELNRPIDSNLIKSYPEADDMFVFYERIKAPIQVLLFGAGNDTLPLAKMIDILGWELTLIDGRKSHATHQRFPNAYPIIVAPADEVINKIKWDDQTVALLMTHNFEYEVMVLSSLIRLQLPYIGILGPKKKTLKLMERLTLQGIQMEESNIFGPIGLDIGAEGSEEIALSVLSEIKSVLAKKTPDHLRDKLGPIHGEER